jgi:heme iron utilization protein
MSEPAAPQKKDPIRPTDDAARALASKLLREARIAALAFTDITTGGPSISRVIIANMPGQGLLTLISDLSAHTQALALYPKCALLLGEPGKGDPLSHPRMSVMAEAVRLPDALKGKADFAVPFLEAHPKTKLYFNFADFAFWRFSIVRVDLNGGFGKAYRLTPDDLF